MKTLIPFLCICAMTAACASGTTGAPKTEMPSTTQTTGAPADTNVPSDDMPIVPLSTTSPTTNPPSASMKNTTSQSPGDAPTPVTPPASMTP